ncbi:MAG: COX15/CtaA family protein [Eudoraea sp.]|nr:COX15/CtaA family protein [Eudoraea sp.]
MRKNYLKIAKISLALVYLVIIAGAVVRMTGSGMGCPDWPKCFGYYIPPTEKAELLWKPEASYKQGQVIILNESLQVAREDFITGSNYNSENWAPYTKHDYAVFNAAHTWTEFINRLLGALAGLAILIMAVFSFSYWKDNKKITVLSWAVVFAMGFQAWLGATVVYSVLEPAKITIHMVMALVIVGMLLYLIHSTNSKIKNHKHEKKTSRLFLLVLVISLVQIILGTQVRQFVDVQIDQLGEQAKQLWLQAPNMQFYIHRSFSIFVVLINLYLAYRIYKLNLGFSKINWVLLLLLFEVISGMAMNYLDFPFGSQPVHLVIASLLFGVQCYLLLEALKAKRSHKTL